MARARINRRIAKLLDQCSFLIHSVELTDEQVAHINQLISFVGRFAAGCTPNPFRTLGLPQPTDSMCDIEAAAMQRLEMVGQVKLTALDLERFPAVSALADFLEHRVRLDLEALRACHEANRLEAYAKWHQSRVRSLADLVPSCSATPPGTQAQADGMRPRGGCSDWS